MKRQIIRHVDVDKPGTWVKYRDGLCDDCMAYCCTLQVDMTAQDLILLECATEWEIENDLKGLIKRLKKEKLIKRYNHKDEKFILEQVGRECVFLNDERRCDVYDKRPLVCREHPEKVGSRVGFCPCTNK